MIIKVSDPKYVPPKLDISGAGVLKVFFKDFVTWYKKNGGVIKDTTLAKKAFDSIMLKMWEKIIVDYYVFTLPYDLGSIYIRENATFTKKTYKDWQASRKAGKIVRGYNFNLDGAKPHVRWKKGDGEAYVFYIFKSIRGEKGKLFGYRGLWGYINTLHNKVYRPNIL